MAQQSIQPNRSKALKANKQRKQSKEQGFMLLSLVFVLMIVSMMVVTYYWHQAEEERATKAKILGNQLAEYVSAVEARLSGDTTFAVGNYADLNFLKSATCHGGTSPNDYVPCDFAFTMFQHDLMANNPVTQVTNITNPRKTATITLSAISKLDGNARVISPYLAAIVLSAAKAHLGADQHAVYNGAATWHFDRATAVISVDVNVVGTNSVWLRTDGGNMMLADLHFDPTQPVNHRQIDNVSNININNADAQINGNGNLTIQSIGQMNQVAAELMQKATNNYQVTAGQQAYIGGNVAKLVGDAQADVASGSNQITIDPSKITFTGVDFDDNSTTTNLNSSITNINRNNGQVYLGNQSGVAGDSNVTVNDMTIHANINGKQDQKLSDLIKNIGIEPHDGYCSNKCVNLPFSVTTGRTGHAQLTIYGGSRSVYGGAYILLRLKHNGTVLKQYGITMNEHEGTYAIANPMFQYDFKGAINTTYTGFAVADDGGGNRDPQYLGWSYIPY
ncbi:hypothetical protein [Cysteiniphilum halobium]|uniref:hypothetical protein n=1 Tax=Cysteiniphilum halobium TaxID=2219059 RepID=UPI000E645DD4|nr:hypothetical protein [Cysteiniphilum halobium]